MHYDAKVSDIESKYFTIPDYNKFTRNIIDARIKEKGLVGIPTIAGFKDNADLNKKLEKLTTKAELKVEQDEIVHLQAFDSGYFRGKSHFEDDGIQNYLKIRSTEHISAWKYKGLSDESIKSPAASGSSLVPTLNYIGV